MQKERRLLNGHLNASYRTQGGKNGVDRVVCCIKRELFVLWEDR